MLSTAVAVAVAVSFVWVGMVMAISFLEAPLKFRAPGITIPLGLGIGRLVFRALNAYEIIWALVLLVTLIVGKGWSTVEVVAYAVAAAGLAAQVIAIRPFLTKRSDDVLAHPDSVSDKRSTAHFWYVGVEVVKVIALLTLGIALLA